VGAEVEEARTELASLNRRMHQPRYCASTGIGLGVGVGVGVGGRSCLRVSVKAVAELLQHLPCQCQLLYNVTSPVDSPAHFLCKHATLALVLQQHHHLLDIKPT
jgi:hypothetical protein